MSLEKDPCAAPSASWIQSVSIGKPTQAEVVGTSFSWLGQQVGGSRLRIAAATQVPHSISLN